tara:strand:+ start:57557 stop:58690 length:1134 start_codon:yes stop_codon:yes gene_type:complete
MATTFKTLLNNDVTSTRTLLHEAIPLTGTIVSGTYIDSGGAEENIKNYAHGMYQSVYDYPYLSSSANHIFDLTLGYSSNCALSSSTATQNSKKINIYNQMAQTLVGYDDSGNIREFDQDGDFSDTVEGKMDAAFFVNFARLLTKDEIKKGSFQLTLMVSGTYIAHQNDAAGHELTLYDADAQNGYKVNSPAGEYGLLYTSSLGPNATDPAGSEVGLIYYQAGIAVITSSIFRLEAGGVTPDPAAPTQLANYFGSREAPHDDIYSSVVDSFVSGNISGSCNGIRNRIKNIQFNNTTELNSTIYFCRANHNEFNYSSNPTYVKSSKIQVKENSLDNPISYITSVGLYSADNELLAVAKLSEPLKKDPTNELTLRVRLDY